MIGIVPAILAVLAFFILFLGLRSVENYRMLVDRDIDEMNAAQENRAAIERIRALAHEGFSVSVRGDVVRLREIRQEFETPIPAINRFAQSAYPSLQSIELSDSFDLMLDAAEQLILGDVPASRALMADLDRRIDTVASALRAFESEKKGAVDATRVMSGHRLRLVSNVAAVLLVMAVILFVVGLLAADRLIRRPLVKILSAISAIPNGQVWEKLPEQQSDDEIHGIHRALNQLAEHEAERQKTVERLDYLAHYDALTNLPNRVLLGELINKEILRLYNQSAVAVIILDLDSFKAVNEGYGYQQGDQLLQKIAERLVRPLDRHATLGRLGGDEFVLVLPELPSPSDAGPKITKLLDLIRRPLSLDGREIAVTACAGVAICSEHNAIESDQMLRNAEQALYQAKQMGPNSYCVFDDERQRQERGHHERISSLEKALKREEFTLFYQPKVNLFTGEVVGVEALIRWLHPDIGLVPPNEFLPDLERHALALDVGRWVIRTALDACNQWRECGVHLPVAVNLFAMQLQRAGFLKEVMDLLDVFPQVDASDIELEIVETAALNDLKKTAQIIQACASHGLQFALDDFGTGYSSLTYLRSLPIRTIKLDQSFVRGMIQASDDEHIIRGVMNIARAFNLKVVAEGVETIEHGVLLQQLGCRIAQGYAIARPMPFDEVLPWLNAWILPEEWRHPRNSQA